MTSQQAQHTDIVGIATEILELSKQYHAEAERTSSEAAILLKANELIAAVQRPQDFAVIWAGKVLEGSALKSLLSFGAIQAIPISGSIGVKELESKTGAQASLLLRLFRALVAGGILKLNADGTYSHTPFSAAYAKDENNVASFFQSAYNEFLPIPSLPEYFRQRGTKEPAGPHSQTHNPRTWYYGKEGKTVFEILEDDPEKLKDFQFLMTMAEWNRPYIGYYDFNKLATDQLNRVVLVDVGGGDGTCIAKILEAYPSISPGQCVVQELESTIELARANPILSPNVQLQTHDFFTSEPVKDARAYFLRSICHDWSDESVITILSHLAAAAAKDSKVLIADNVWPEAAVGSMEALQDMVMLCIGGKERTKSAFEHLLDQAGLKLDAVYPSGNPTGFSIVEASLK